MLDAAFYLRLAFYTVYIGSKTVYTNWDSATSAGMKRQLLWGPPHGFLLILNLILRTGILKNYFTNVYPKLICTHSRKIFPRGALSLTHLLTTTPESPRHSGNALTPLPTPPQKHAEGGSNAKRIYREKSPCPKANASEKTTLGGGIPLVTPPPFPPPPPPFYTESFPEGYPHPPTHPKSICCQADTLTNGYSKNFITLINTL